MNTIFGFLAALQHSDDGLTLAEMVESLPTDPASLFVLALTLGSFALVLWAGLRKGKGPGPGGTGSTA